MLCIDLIKLSMVMLWGLTIFNSIVVIVLIISAKGYSKTANEVFYNRYSRGSYKFSAIEDLITARDKIIIRLEELEKKENIDKLK